MNNCSMKRCGCPRLFHYVAPGQIVMVPNCVPYEQHHAWALGYWRAKEDYRAYEQGLPRSGDDTPSLRTDGFLEEGLPRS